MSAGTSTRGRWVAPVLRAIRGRVGAAAVLVSALAITLEVLDLTRPGFRRWWMERPLTTTLVAGILVVLVTVLVVDRVLRLRQVADRAMVTAAQAAIVLAQATRAVQMVSEALDACGDRETASGELRTYTSMLLVAAPVLIDAKRPRDFLLEAQHLGAELVRLMASSKESPSDASATDQRLDAALTRLRTAADPLLAVFGDEQRIAAATDGS